MSYIIGAITLPCDAVEIVPRYPKNTKGIPLLIMQPYLADLGPNTPILRLRGFMVGTSGIEALYTSYVNTLIWYAQKPASFPAILLDESPTTDWASYTNGAGSYAITRANATSNYVYGIHSLSSVIGAGASATVGFQRDFGAAGRNWYANDFLSWCWRGSASTNTWKLSIIDAAGAWSYYDFADTGASTWSRFFIRKDQLTVGAGTLDWRTIRYIRFSVTPSGAGRTNFIDRACIGTGVLVDFPGARYDGIYLLTDAQFPETGGRVNSIDFTMELSKVDDYYGRLSTAV